MPLRLHLARVPVESLSRLSSLPDLSRSTYFPTVSNDREDVGIEVRIKSNKGLPIAGIRSCVRDLDFVLMALSGACAKRQANLDA